MPSFAEQVQTVKDHLRGAIFRGELPPGAQILEKDVQTGTGSSVRAVQQALVDLAKEGLIGRKRHVGTFVSRKTLVSGPVSAPRLQRVAVLSALNERNFKQNLYIQAVLTGMRSALEPPAEVQALFNPEAGATRLNEPPPMTAERLRAEFPGVLTIELSHTRYLDELQRAGLAVVAVDYYHSRMAFDCVTVDHQEAGFLAVQHLLGLGHRRIAFAGEGVNPASNDPTWQDRLTGYLRGMAGTGGETPVQWLLDVHRNHHDLRRRLPEFHRAHRPTAYVLSSGNMAEAALEILAVEGLECPRDVSLAVCDSGLQSVGSKALSRASVDYELFGRTAVRVLASRLGCRHMPPVRVTVPVDFKPGYTSRPL